MADGRRRNPDGTTSVVKKTNGKSSSSRSSSSSKKPAASSNTKKDIATYKEGINAGKDVANSVLGKDFTLGRVDESIPKNVQDLIDTLYTRSTTAGQNNSRQEDALNSLKDLKDTAGTRSADTQYGIDEARKLYEKAGQTTPDQQLAIDTMKGGLGGLNSAESQAYWESLTNPNNLGFTGALESLAQTGAASGLGPNKALAEDAANQYLQSQLNNANNLAVQNIGIQDARRGQFADYVRAVGNDIMKNSQDSLGLYNNSVNAAGTNEFNQRLASGQAYNSAVEANTNNNRNDQLANLSNYQNELYRTRTDQLNRSLSNINTLASEVSARTGIVMGVPAYLQGAQASRDALNIAKMGAGGGGSGSGGSGSSSGGSGNSTPAANDSWGTPQANFTNPGTTSGVTNSQI